MALTVGITGGIGSGKTTVCRFFEILGTPVFEADKAGKRLLDTHPKVKKEMIDLFGEDIYTSDGTINRKKLAGIIFNDQFYLSRVNELVHPAVREEFFRWLKDHHHFPYVVHEAAILFESGFYKLMDFTLLVTAPEKERIKRVMERNQISKKKIKERMSHQFSEKKKARMADVVLLNDNTHLIIPEIIEIDKKLKKYGKIW